MEQNNILHNQIKRSYRYGGTTELQIFLEDLYFSGFLDASTHLYKRLCPLVRWSVGPWVSDGFFSQWGIQVNSSKFK